MRRAGLLLLLLLLPLTAGGEEPVPNRFGAALSAAHTYSPGGVDFGLVTAVALFDYDRVWPHRAPEPLRFKVEASLGASSRPHTRTIASANMLALYYLEEWRTARLRPYVEAGIGVIYTDFQLSGQGLRLNFNPQAGIGAEIGPTPWFAALRLHHISNANLHDDNRGVNSVLLQVGRYFQ